MAKKIPREDLLEELQSVSEDLGRTPTRSEFSNRAEYSSRPYDREFGSWNGALEAADMTLNKRMNIPKSELISEISRLGNELNKVPTADDLKEHGKHSLETYDRRFESWVSVLEMAGFEIPEERTRLGDRISTQDLVKELQGLANRMMKVPTASDMEQFGKYHSTVYRDRFGSWGEAKNEAGVCIGGCNLPELETTPPKGRFSGPTKIPEEQLLTYIKELESELGRTPTTRDLRERPGYDASTYFSRFGSWKNAKQSAGLDTKTILPGKRAASREELIDEIHNIADQVNGTPTKNDIENRSRYSTSPFEREFESWNDVLRAEGYDLNILSSIPENDLMSELKDLAGEIGCAPSQKYMNENGRFSARTYELKYDSWNTALREAGLEPLHTFDSGGDYPGYYGSNWPDARKAAIDRDDCCCQACGLARKRHRQQYNRDLEVHHVKPVVDFEKPVDAHSPSNLITLCSRCHGRVEGSQTDLEDLVGNHPSV